MADHEREHSHSELSVKKIWVDTRVDELRKSTEDLALLPL